MVSIALTLQEIVYVTGPFIIRTLASSFMPVVPVLPAYKVSVDIVVSITFFQLVIRVVMILPVVVIVSVVVIIVAIAVDRVIVIVISII